MGASHKPKAVEWGTHRVRRLQQAKADRKARRYDPLTQLVKECEAHIRQHTGRSQVRLVRKATARALVKQWMEQRLALAEFEQQHARYLTPTDPWDSKPTV